MTTATFFEAGQQAWMTCRLTEAEHVHTFWPDRREWQCSHCGTFTAPDKPPKVLQPSEREYVTPSGPRATGIRVQPTDAAPFTLPAQGGFRLALIPDGSTVVGSDAHYEWPLEDIQRLTTIYAKGTT
jgi:hypothetical protein